VNCSVRPSSFFSLPFSTWNDYEHGGVSFQSYFEGRTFTALMYWLPKLSIS
jgi:hypothetical protein